MIFGKINPVATLVKKSRPFSQTTVTGSYIAAVASPYRLGDNKVNFQVFYGNCTFDTGSGEVKRFESVYVERMEVSGPLIDNWGTDDTALLSGIANLQGTAVTEIVSGNAKVS